MSNEEEKQQTTHKKKKEQTTQSKNYDHAQTAVGKKKRCVAKVWKKNDNRFRSAAEKTKERKGKKTIILFCFFYPMVNHLLALHHKANTPGQVGSANA